MKYKAIILVLASDDDCIRKERWNSDKLRDEWKPLYPFFKKIWESYHDTNDNIKVLYVYGNTTEVKKDYDLLFDDIRENNYPGMITKTLRAFKFIEENYDYDFLIRTNLSTFWNLNLLEKRLDLLPKNNCLTGTEVTKQEVCSLIKNQINNDSFFDNYIAGHDMIMSRDLIINIIPFSENVIKQKVFLNMEDLSLCLGFKNYLSIDSKKININDETMCMSMNNVFSEELYNKKLSLSKQKKLDHYRMRNRLNRNVDKKIAVKLLKDIYGKIV